MVGGLFAGYLRAFGFVLLRGVGFYDEGGSENLSLYSEERDFVYTEVFRIMILCSVLLREKSGWGWEDLFLHATFSPISLFFPLYFFCSVLLLYSIYILTYISKLRHLITS